MNRKTARAFAFVMLKTLLILLVFVILLHFVIAVRICRSNDMYPNVRDGDLVVLQRTHDVTFDDVILYEHDGIEYIGRIVAVAGETVVISDEHGLVVNDSIVYNPLPYETKMPEEGERLELKVPDGQVFVLGDFRSDSRDSREFGCIDKASAIGRQIYLMRWRGF